MLRERGITTCEYKVIFGGDEKVLERDNGDDYIILWMYLLLLDCTLKM